MKSNEFAKALARSSELAQGFGQSNDANQLAELSKFFSGAGTQTVKALLKKCSELEVANAGVFGTSAEGLSDIVEALARFVENTGKKALATDLNELSRWLHRYEQADFKDLLHKAEAALEQPVKKKATSKATAVAAAAVNSYLQRLDETYGFETEFEAVYSDLQSDPLMKAAQLKKLAKLFTKQPASSAEQALRSIYRKHSNLIEADRHKAARGGRIAG